MADGPLIAVLAAGRGTRFGGGKMEANCAGKPLGRWVLDAVERAGLRPGIVVTGPEGVGFAQGWTQVVNANPDSGLGSSLALAASMALSSRRKALLVLLADMPLISPAYLREMANGPAPMATRYPDGHPGVPALLGKPLIVRAAKLAGDRGAGPLLGQARLLDAPPDGLRDVDTPQDLAEVERILADRV